MAEQPSIVARAVIEHDGRILLLVRAAQDDVRPGEYDLPGGGIEASDASIVEGIVREIEEETGLVIRANLLREIAVSYTSTAPHIERHVFYCSLAKLGTVRLDPNEHSSYEWLAASDALKLYQRPVYSEAIQKLVDEKLV